MDRPIGLARICRLRAGALIGEQDDLRRLPDGRWIEQLGYGHQQDPLYLGRVGDEFWEVVDAAKTKPFGFQAFYPGPGLGGHCIPIDPFYLSWVARKHGMPTRFIELAGEINTSMPQYVIDRVAEALNEQGKPQKLKDIYRKKRSISPSEPKLCFK